MVELRPRTARGTVAKTDAEEILRSLDADAVDSPVAEGSEGDVETWRAAKLPAPVQFPLVVILSLTVSSLGQSLLGTLTQGELAAVSKPLDTGEDIALVTGWRILELAIGWFGNLDSIDLAALSILCRGPSLYLLATFYDVRPASVLSALAVHVLSTFIPFQLLRPVSRAHADDKSVPNREIIADPAVQVYTVALSTVVYSVSLLLAYKTFLPRVLVLYFEGIHSVAPAYDATYSSVTPVAVLLGLAAKTFIFTPLASTGRSAEDKKLQRFDPVRASLGETFVYNVWGYTTKAKVGILRTAVAVVLTFVNTYLQCAKVVAGVEPAGAAGYAAVWTVAALFSGVGLGLVGRS
ncbi:uncharacterized protein DNG_03267 [Cephalotrichum gorgonifer]|uniref:Uncharacterized protein n=1 Tax=Cephalotrichum gorgonifer TaxID=2041049 RepID=A0AAE8MWR7_9PEZI|nr:uncharacterized protein DNG_03267 [Cephalotrichum gorgonifer]